MLSAACAPRLSSVCVAPLRLILRLSLPLRLPPSLGSASSLGCARSCLFRLPSARWGKVGRSGESALFGFLARRRQGNRIARFAGCRVRLRRSTPSSMREAFQASSFGLPIPLRYRVADRWDIVQCGQPEDSLVEMTIRVKLALIFILIYIYF